MGIRPERTDMEDEDGGVGANGERPPGSFDGVRQLRSNGHEQGGKAASTTIDQLYSELEPIGNPANKGTVRLTPDQRSEVIMDDVVDRLFEEPSFSMGESAVKTNLDEILLLLIAHRTADTNGKNLMGDLAAIFSTRLSPGTVYPQLHALEEGGALSVHELVRTKEYRIQDEAVLAERVTLAMEQNLVLGHFFRAALSDLYASN